MNEMVSKDKVNNQKFNIQFFHDTNGILATVSIKYGLKDLKQWLPPALYLELQNNFQTD
jgi:hypothetical protein